MEMSKASLFMSSLRQTSSNPRKTFLYKASIWILTFLVYMTYHLSRKPITVVQNALHSTCNNVTSDAACFPNSSWAPFDNPKTYQSYFGALDVSYLAAYAVGMFASGHIAERMNIRYFLTLGMTLSALMTLAFGLGYSWKIHSLAYFVIVQILCGIVQSTGWPGVVSVMGSWFGKGKRGLIMGIWNAHTSVGNILGGLIASAFLTSYWEDKGYWMWSFTVPALIMMFMAITVFCFLIPEPNDVGLTIAENRRNTESSPLLHSEDDEYPSVTSINPGEGKEGETKAVSFFGALKVPGVVEFSLCLFFAKLVSYTFLYWLPEYIKEEMTENVHMADPDATAGQLATIVDVGGIFGAIAAGYVADVSRSSAITCAVMLVLSVPAMVVYRTFGALSYSNAIGLLLVTGFMVNGPYCLITTSVSADLGTHPSLSKNAKALATVTAIIDGTGSIGAAIGPGLTAMIEGLQKPQAYKMDVVFGMLIGSNILALLLISRLIYKEALALRARRRSQL